MAEDDRSDNRPEDYEQPGDEGPDGPDQDEEDRLAGPGPMDVNPNDPVFATPIEEFPVVIVTGDIMGETAQDIYGGTYSVHEPSQVNPDVVPVTGDISEAGPEVVRGSSPYTLWLPSWAMALIALVFLGAFGAYMHGFGFWDSKPSTSNPPSSSTAAGFHCTGNQAKLFDNWNFSGIDSAGAPPTFSTNGKAYCLTHIETYHWNDGKGATPGTLGLTRVSGGGAGPAKVGPFTATGSSGQDNAPNVNWAVDPSTSPLVIIDGTYLCDDSGSASWSANTDSGGLGFCMVDAIPAVSN